MRGLRRRMRNERYIPTIVAKYPLNCALVAYINVIMRIARRILGLKEEAIPGRGSFFPEELPPHVVIYANDIESQFTKKPCCL